MKPVSREGYKFRQDICVPCYQTNRNADMRPAAVMDLAQEIAYWAAMELGFGYDTLHVHHIAWVLSRLHIHFEKPLRWRDGIRLYTWHKGGSGLFYLRDFEFMGPDGSLAASATSSWVVIDERTRRFVRPEDLPSTLALDYEVDHAIEEPSPKVVFPKGTEPEAAGEHIVTYSDIDIVGHTNNARYVVWAMDCLPLEVALAPMKDLYINFNKETTAGEAVQLFRLRDGNAWYVEGRVDGKSCFVVKMEY